MRDVTVRKIELITIIEANRAEHKQIFDEAVEGYRKQAVELLEKHIDSIKNGKLQPVRVILPVPENHTADYDRVLKMLQMHVEDQVEIPEDEFSSYVMDDWAWKRQFLDSTTPYSATAAGKIA